jgi:Flp pilus assembly pilin Flp
MKMMKKTSKGATFTEYSVMVGMVSVVSIVTMLQMGGDLQGVFTTANDDLEAASAAGLESDDSLLGSGEFEFDGNSDGGGAGDGSGGGALGPPPPAAGDPGAYPDSFDFSGDNAVFSVSNASSSTGTVGFTIEKTAALVIDWGDGTIEHISTTGGGGFGSPNSARYTHTYADSSVYYVRIVTPDYEPQSVVALQQIDGLSDMISFGNIGLQNISQAFAGQRVPSVPVLPSTVTNVSGAFYGTTGPIFGASSWNVDNVTNMANLFRDAPDFNQDLQSWDVSNVTDASSLFQNADAFNGQISDWRFENLSFGSGMFNDADAFNQPLVGWRMPNTTDLSTMFQNADVFNQDLSSWCVPSITRAPPGFSDGGVYTLAKPVWGSCPAQN